MYRPGYSIASSIRLAYFLHVMSCARDSHKCKLISMTCIQVIAGCW